MYNPVLRATLNIGVCAGILLAAMGQGPVRSSAQRREELAKVQESLADPDPLARLAALETIVKSGDTTSTQMALRTAFAGDDADLRALALRGYLATIRDLTFDIALPPDRQKALDQAQGNSVAMKQFVAENRYLGSVQNVGSKFRLVVAEYDFPSVSGNVNSGRKLSAFTIKGDRFSTITNFGLGECYVDFAPASAQLLQGGLDCGHGWPRLPISSRMF